MIKIIQSVGRDLLSYLWPLTKRNNVIRLLILVAAVIAVTMLTSTPAAEVTETEAKSPIVLVGTVDSLQQSNSASFIGTVRAVSEAQIQSEVGGRVTSVAVAAGDQVSAGAVVATLENASERAAVLQAEGSYEAALAAAAQSDVSVEDAENSLTAAKNSAVSAYRSAYTTATDVVLQTLDQFYADPTGAIPGVRINAEGQAGTLNTARIALQDDLPAWQASANALTASGDIATALTEAVTQVNEIITIVDIFTDAAGAAEPTDTLNGQAVTSFVPALTGARASLNATLANLESAETSLIAAEERLRTATIGSTQDSTVSAANAQVKQALGSLRSAQASLAKTILRSPIAGTVNTVSVNTGDFIGSFTPVAEVANNDALEISVFVGDADIAQIAVGDTVMIETMSTGTVTNIAPAIDPTTLKTEVKIATESTTLTNGDTVTVALNRDSESVVNNGPILVPIAAVKFTVTDGNMFVVEDGKLVSVPVTVGPIVGSFVTITSGIERSTEFVLDVRGLSTGQTVETLTE